MAATLRSWLALLGSMKLRYEIIAVNDGSTDATAEELLSVQRHSAASVRIIEHDRNCGYGIALQTGIRASSGDWIVLIDSDGQYPAAALEKILEARSDGIDCINGARMKKKDTLLRVWANSLLNFLIRLLFALKLKDFNSGLKCIRGNLLRSLHLRSHGIIAPSEILIRLHRLGATITEIPVTHAFRQRGRSSIHVVGTAFASFRFLIAMRLEKRKI